MADQIGHMECPECKRSAQVWTDKRMFLYLNCSHDEGAEKTGCGIFKYQTKAGQRRIKDRYQKFGEPLGNASEPVPGTDNQERELLAEPAEPAPVEPKQEKPVPKTRPPGTGRFSVFKRRRGHQ